MTVVLVASLAVGGMFLSDVKQASAGNDIADGTANQLIDTQTQPGTGSEPSVLAQSGVLAPIIKMLSALVIVVLVVYGALYLLKRLMARQHGKLPAGTLEVLETTCIGPNKTVSLVKVGKRSVLVGVTDNQISTLTQLDAIETREIISLAAEPSDRESFARVFSATAARLKDFSNRKTKAALETR